MLLAAVIPSVGPTGSDILFFVTLSWEPMHYLSSKRKVVRDRRSDKKLRGKSKQVGNTSTVPYCNARPLSTEPEAVEGLAL